LRRDFDAKNQQQSAPVTAGDRWNAAVEQARQARARESVGRSPALGSSPSINNNVPFNVAAPLYFQQQQALQSQQPPAQNTPQYTEQWRRYEADRQARDARRTQTGSVSVQNNAVVSMNGNEPWKRYGLSQDQYWKVVRENVGQAGSGMQNPWGLNFDINAPISKTNKKTWDQVFREEAAKPTQQRNPITGNFDLDPFIRQSGDVIYRPHSPGVDVLAQQLTRVIPGFQYYSSFDDEYHHKLYKQKGQDSQHRHGLALDLAVDGGKKGYAAAKQAVIQHMTRLQIPQSDYYIQDEANSPSAYSTAPHLHIEFTSKAAAQRFREMFPDAPLSKYAQK
jgi:hypothetical protein